MDAFMKNQTLPRYLHTMLQILLLFFAIFPKDYKLHSSVYYSVQIIIVGGALVGSSIPLYMATESVVKLEIFATIIPQLADLLIFTYFSYKEKELLKLIHSLASKNSNNELERTNRFLRANFVTYFILHTAWASLFIVHTLIYLLSGHEFSHKYSIMIPFWLSCDVRPDNRLCWKTDSSWELWLANIFTTIAVGFEYASYCTACILYSVFMANVWIHLQTLRTSIRSMASRMKSQCRINFMKFGKVEEYDDAVMEEFYENIKNQQMIRGYCNEIIEVMRGYVSIFLAEFWGTLVFLGFTSIMEVKNDRLLVIKTAIISVSGAIGFVVHCVYAQMMTDLNEMILHEMADIPWYEQGIRFRKNYLMCLTHNQKSIQVTAGGMFTFNYGFSMNCLKTMYSFLNMMLLHYKRKGSL
ncbi:uncharacterized protein LOC135847828 [Planococcus citri]|uniref:uncharacterized protein LOC135847828 n=1 Tax=Planococcus citri TaxID=170843 RepID=UPI0031FA4324